MKRIAVFGATGSVGSQTLDIIRAHPEELDVACIAADRSIGKLERLTREFPNSIVAVSDSAKGSELASHCPDIGALYIGAEAMIEALDASRPDLAVIAVSGMSGLPLLEACLTSRIPVALANKEAIVSGGKIISNLRRLTKTRIIPLDSEHAALYQCLGDSLNAQSVAMMWLTASGGPFREWSVERLQTATAEDALKHPTWSMGRKITIDCSTLANKGLEVIEAHYLFSMPGERIRVVVQPGSLVHSMVEFQDTSVLAQLAPPDMHVPIRRALLGPDSRDSVGADPIDFWKVGSITFEKPDMERFPCLALAYEAIGTGESAVYNAADEVAALSFGAGQIPFPAVPRLIEAALREFEHCRTDNVPGILELDRQVRYFTEKSISRKEY